MLENERTELNERIHQLEQDLEDAETNATDLHQMLDELVSEKKESVNFQVIILLIFVMVNVISCRYIRETEKTNCHFFICILGSSRPSTSNVRCSERKDREPYIRPSAEEATGLLIFL